MSNVKKCTSGYERPTKTGVSLTLCCFVVYSTRRFVLCFTLCYFVLAFFCPFSIAITSLGEERANLSALRRFVRFVLVWFCRFPLPLGGREGLRFMIVALPEVFSYLFFLISLSILGSLIRIYVVLLKKTLQSWLSQIRPIKILIRLI